MTVNGEYEGHPDWSPDGDQVVFETDDGLFLMNAEGGNRQRLTRGLRHSNPEWSPDGNEIVFDDGYFDIFVLDVETETIRKLTHRRQPEFAPAWSPDGRHIVFRSTSADCEYCGSDWPMQVWVMNSDGSQAHRITRRQGYGAPSWGATD